MTIVDLILAVYILLFVFVFLTFIRGLFFSADRK